MKRIFTALGMLVCINACGLEALAQTTPQITKGNCDSCAVFCEKTLNYCTQKRGKHGEATTTNALKDCITACKMTSEFIGRGSAFQKQSANLCIEACNNCMKACDSFISDNNMKACANECRKTSGNCKKIASAN